MRQKRQPKQELNLLRSSIFSLTYLSNVSSLKVTSEIPTIFSQFLEKKSQLFRPIPFRSSRTRPNPFFSQNPPINQNNQTIRNHSSLDKIVKKENQLLSPGPTNPFFQRLESIDVDNKDQPVINDRGPLAMSFGAQKTTPQVKIESTTSEKIDRLSRINQQYPPTSSQRNQSIEPIKEVSTRPQFPSNNDLKPANFSILSSQNKIESNLKKDSTPKSQNEFVIPNFVPLTKPVTPIPNSNFSSPKQYENKIEIIPPSVTITPPEVQLHTSNTPKFPIDNYRPPEPQQNVPQPFTKNPLDIIQPQSQFPSQAFLVQPGPTPVFSNKDIPLSYDTPKLEDSLNPSFQNQPNGSKIQESSLLTSVPGYSPRPAFITPQSQPLDSQRDIVSRTETILPQSSNIKDIYQAKLARSFYDSVTNSPRDKPTNDSILQNVTGWSQAAPPEPYTFELLKEQTDQGLLNPLRPEDPVPSSNSLKLITVPKDAENTSAIGKIVQKNPGFHKDVLLLARPKEFVPTRKSSVRKDTERRSERESVRDNRGPLPPAILYSSKDRFIKAYMDEKIRAVDDRNAKNQRIFEAKKTPKTKNLTVSLSKNRREEESDQIEKQIEKLKETMRLVKQGGNRKRRESDGNDWHTNVVSLDY